MSSTSETHPEPLVADVEVEHPTLDPKIEESAMGQENGSVERQTNGTPLVKEVNGIPLEKRLSEVPVLSTSPVDPVAVPSPTSPTESLLESTPNEPSEAHDIEELIHQCDGLEGKSEHISQDTDVEVLMPATEKMVAKDPIAEVDSCEEQEKESQLLSRSNQSLQDEILESADSPQANRSNVSISEQGFPVIDIGSPTTEEVSFEPTTAPAVGAHHNVEDAKESHIPIVEDTEDEQEQTKDNVPTVAQSAGLPEATPQDSTVDETALTSESELNTEPLGESVLGAQKTIEPEATDIPEKAGLEHFLESTGASVALGQDSSASVPGAASDPGPIALIHEAGIATAASVDSKEVALVGDEVEEPALHYPPSSEATHMNQFQTGEQVEQQHTAEGGETPYGQELPISAPLDDTVTTVGLEPESDASSIKADNANNETASLPETTRDIPPTSTQGTNQIESEAFPPVDYDPTVEVGVNVGDQTPSTAPVQGNFKIDTEDVLKAVTEMVEVQEPTGVKAQVIPGSDTAPHDSYPISETPLASGPPMSAGDELALAIERVKTMEPESLEAAEQVMFPHGFVFSLKIG